MPDPSSPLPGRQVKRPDYSLPTGLTTTLSRGVTGGSITAGLPVSLSCPTRYGLGFRADIAAAGRPVGATLGQGRPGLGPNVWLHITRSYRAVNRPLSSRALPALPKRIAHDGPVPGLERRPDEGLPSNAPPGLVSSPSTKPRRRDRSDAAGAA